MDLCLCDHQGLPPVHILQPNPSVSVRHELSSRASHTPHPSEPHPNPPPPFVPPTAPTCPLSPSVFGDRWQERWQEVHGALPPQLLEFLQGGARGEGAGGKGLVGSMAWHGTAG